MTKKILIVEDQTLISLWLISALRAIGYDPLGPAEDSETAFDLVRRHNPDLILMDIKIKGPIDGIETARLLKTVSEAPVIFTTSFEDAPVIEKAKEVDPAGFLLKPLQKNQLQVSIEMALYKYDLQRELKRQQTLLNAFFEASPAAMVITDQDFNLLKWNDTFVQYCGSAVRDGGHLSELVTGVDFESLRETESSVFEVTMPAHTSQFYELACRQILNRNTLRPLMYVFVITDITGRKSLEKRMSELNHELEQKVLERTKELLNYTRELEDYSFSVSHDLRAPLRAIEGMSSLLTLDYGQLLDDQGRDYLNRIAGAARRLSNLIEELRGLSEITRAEIRPVDIDLSQLIGQLAEAMVRKYNPENPQIRIQENLIAKGDYPLVKMAFGLLADNAFKYRSPSREFVFEAGNCIIGGVSFFYIRDNGIGFDEAFSNKLFKPFEKIHDDGSAEGMGIGLAKVQRIARKHGGEIFARSVPDQGASFYIRLGT